jgi:hypothetical protein
MTQDSDSPKPLPPWRDIAQALLAETDQAKMLQLASQLAEAIERQVLIRKPASASPPPNQPSS